MPDKTTSPEETVIDVFRAYLTGRVARGLAHNMNGMLQVMSMQIELLKRSNTQDKQKIDGLLSQAPQESGSPSAAMALIQDIKASLDKKDGRIMELQGVLLKLEGMSELIASRGQGAKGRALMAMDAALREEIDFLRADLFFKHQISTGLDMPSSTITILTNERLFKDLIDVALLICINQIKRLEKSEKKEIKIGLVCEGSQLKLFFSHTGRPFDMDENNQAKAGGTAGSLQDELLLEHFIAPIHTLINLIAEKLDAVLEVSPQTISFVFSYTI